MTDKGFPKATEAETALLGCMLMDSTLIKSVLSMVQRSDFYQGTNGRIFDLLLQMHERGDVIDQLTVSETVASSPNPDDYGGPAHVLSLADRIPSTLNAAGYATLIRDNSVRRMLVIECHKLSLSVQQGSTSIPEAIAHCSSISKRAAEMAPGQDLWKSMKDVINAHDKEMVERYKAASQNKVIGVPTGLLELDHKLGGLKPGKSYIFAARPAMGKSAALGNILTHAAQNGFRCAEFSLEMGDVELVDRIIANVANINYGKIQSGMLDSLDQTKMDDAKERMWNWPLHMDDSPNRTIDQICAASRQLKARYPDLALVGVDYIQLAQASTAEARKKREQAVSEISRELKLLARELDIATVCLAQLNRECERRPNKRPLLSDLRESGSIEQNADAVIFIYRDEYYNEESPDKGLAEFLIRKNRGGATGKVQTVWTPEHQRFMSLSKQVIPMYSATDFTEDPDEARYDSQPHQLS